MSDSDIVARLREIAESFDRGVPRVLCEMNAATLRDAIAALDAKDAEIARLREALVKVRAHTGYLRPSDGKMENLLMGLLVSIERITAAALAAKGE